MKWLRRTILGLWNRLWHGRLIKFRHVTKLPAKLDKHTCYIVGENGNHWHVAMICPCGCKQTLFMNLLPDENPFWTFTEHPDGSVSLHPSVWRKIGCRSHFFLKKGRIKWCEA